jgi:hypothetical protein
MDYERIYAWTAKRAGGYITVSGKTRQGNARKVVNINTITAEQDGAGDPLVVAIHDDGTKYELAL